MPVLINNKRILPSPLVTFEKTIELSDDGRFLGSSYNVNFDGNILQNKGNPVVSVGSNFNSSFSTDPWTSTRDSSDDPIHGVSDSDLLISTITKIERLRDALSPATGIKVEIVGFDHNKGLKFYGDLKSFSVANENNWANPASYTFSIGFNNFIESANSGLFPDGSSEDKFTYYVQSASDRWSIQEADQYVINTGDFTQIAKVYNVTRSIEAKGKRIYDESGVVKLQPWQQASGYVISVLDTNSTLPDSILGVTSGYYLTNRKLVENIDKLAGTYSLEESFMYVPSGSMPSGQYAIEETSLSIEKSESSIITVSLGGTITGIETNNPYLVSGTGVSKYNNALNYYNFAKSHFYNRARQNCGLNWLHPKPKSVTEGRNPYAGQITYSYNYDDRPPNLIPGSITEEISVSDTHPGQLFSATPVIGRNQPILQYLGSRSEYKRSLSINVIMERDFQNWANNEVDSSGRWTTATASGIRSWFSTQKPSVVSSGYFQTIYDAVNPANESGVLKNKCFYTAPQESWNPKTGNYSYNIEWTYERE